jgi:DNA-binding transcriptional LysR family regulator
MWWDDIALFLAVAREGSLSAAARTLGIHVSTVQRRLGGLEQTLGATLFDRRPDGYALTSVGEAMVPHAERLEADAAALHRAVGGHDRSLSGPVRFTLPASLLGVVAPHLAAFHEAHPGVRPEMLVDARVYDLGRETDVALRPGTPPERAVGRRVADEAWAVYGPVDAEGELPWAVFSERAQLPVVRWRRRTWPDVTPILTVNGVDAMHRVLRCVQAQGVLPCYVGDADRRLARRSVLAPDRVPLWLLVHADLRRSARVRALVDFLHPRLAADRPLIEGERGPS